MATKKAVKKVEIADNDGVVNLKKREKPDEIEMGEMVPVSFNVHRIDESNAAREMDFGLPPVGRLGGEDGFGNDGKGIGQGLQRESFMDRTPRTPVVTQEAPSPKFDQDELHKRMESFAEKLERAVIKVAPAEGSNHNFPPNVAAEPRDLIKVKFEKFVQLVATKDFLTILEKNKDEDVVISSNLLTELASAVEEKSEKKSPVIFLVGLAIGVIITYLLLNHR